MAVKTIDLSHLEQAKQALQAIATRRAQKATTRWDGLYYQLMAKYFENLLTAREQGKLVATQSDVVPAELLYAMDIVPFHISMVSCATAVLLREQETYLSAAKAFGLTPEVCSVHRVAASFFVQGWAPPVDAVIFSNESCDNNAKSSELVAHTYDAPSFYLDCPFYFSEASFRFLAGELEELARFLSRLSGRPLDIERLQEVLRNSQRVVELTREINQLRQAIPYPANSRLGLQAHLIRWYWQGQPEAVQFFEAMRDELRERVAHPQTHPEKYRFLSLFSTPNHSWKLLDWMEREHSAFVVFEPHRYHWGPIKWDFSNPFYTLAQRVLAEPVAYLTFSPIQQWVKAVVESARAFQVNGAIWWAHSGCRQACATIRSVKDAISEIDIPTLVLDVDTVDPTFVSDDELKEKLEGFFELLEERE